MPIYEYQCSKCHRVTEKLQGFSDPPLKSCPHCRGRVHKLVSHSSFVLKGGGWYKDGYSSSGAGASSNGGNGGTKPAKETKTDSKPAEKKAEKKTEKAAA